MVNVIKRNKSIESVFFDKITTRLKKLCNNLPIDVTIIAQKTISNICAELGDYNYNLLGGRILVSNLKKKY